MPGPTVTTAKESTSRPCPNQRSATTRVLTSLFTTTGRPVASRSGPATSTLFQSSRAE